MKNNLDIMSKDNLSKIGRIMQKAYSRCQEYNKILVCLSGGADSDIMLDILLKVCDKGKLTFVFFDTGIEYEATKRHLTYLENKYNIKIKRERALKSVPFGCKQYGVPFWSKYVSEMIERLQKHNFDFHNDGNLSYDELIKKYPNCRIALQWWCNNTSGKFTIQKDKYLKEFLIEYPPDFRISNKCCNGAKKKTAEKYEKNKDFDLKCMGIRKSEGGIRTLIYKSCFDYKPNEKKQNFRPIFWLTDEDKRVYEHIYNIKHSDCYAKYGMKRTGCAGCPFSSRFESELVILKQYEPILYNAVCNIFKYAYDYTRKYIKYKERMKNSKQEFNDLQLNYFDLLGGKQ